MEKTLKICETFLSLQGESSYAGKLCFFIRLHGCNLNCVYCDTPYAKSGAEFTERTIEELLNEALQSQSPLVEITGGEPILQASAVAELCRELIAHKLTVLIETNGSLPLDILPEEAVRIIDCKTPGSGEEKNNLWDNFVHPRKNDQFKFVITSREDYLYAMDILKKYSLKNAIFSPCWEKIKSAILAEWMIEDRCSATMQLQMHKYIWNPDERAR